MKRRKKKRTKMVNLRRRFIKKRQEKRQIERRKIRKIKAVPVHQALQALVLTQVLRAVQQLLFRLLQAVVTINVNASKDLPAQAVLPAVQAQALIHRAAAVLIVTRNRKPSVLKKKGVPNFYQKIRRIVSN